MAKKDFTNIQTGANYDAVELATAEEAEAVWKERKDRKTYTEKEAAEFRRNASTAGRKGVHLKRVNIALTDEVYDYIKIVSRMQGWTMTRFINEAMARFMEEHPALLNEANRLRDLMDRKGTYDGSREEKEN